ncbi:MAG: hypothetical protein POELPBGB_04064 [Bacteroidia bacterium]|nr:hypothetical protein [Bacteroidia bacterium]MCK6384153.1 PEPxxWA-CTERM sorting domain-containing protein [Rhodocyclaceae bacterium]CAG0928499.1 hypothetical protein RHDC3_00784 [Rhodocyclaceae bacterium]
MHIVALHIPPHGATTRHAALRCSPASILRHRRVGAALGAALGLLLGMWNTAARGEIVNVGETLNVTGHSSFPTVLGPGEVCSPICYGSLMMDGGTLRIGDPATGRALSISATDAILARGIISHWYAQTPGTTFDFFGTTAVPGGASGPYPADGMYLRASPFDSQGMTVRNFGTFVQSGTGEITLSGPVRFVNETSATYFIQNDRGILDTAFPGGGMGAFLNMAGSAVVKTSGSGTSRIEVPFDQQNGKVEVWSGGIDLLSGGNHVDARFYADALGSNVSGAGIGFGGVHTFNGSTLTETGSFRAFSGSGQAINLDSGIWDQNARFEAFGRININPGAILRNSGSLETFGLAGGRISVSGTGAGVAVFHNTTPGAFKGSLITEPGFEDRLYIYNQGQFMVGVGDTVLAGDIDNTGQLAVSDALGARDIANSGQFTIGASGSVNGRNFVNTAGVLTVDGRLDNWGGSLQLIGGVLQGGGIINGNAFIGGGPTIAVFTPGHSPGTMTIHGEFALLPNGVLEIEIERDTLTGLIAFDRVIADSYLLDGRVSFIVGSGIETTDVNFLDFLGCGGSICVNYGSNFSFDFPGRPGSQLIASADGLWIASLAPVPEPETWALMMAGLGLLGFAARRRV